MSPEPSRRALLAGGLCLFAGVSGCLTFTGGRDQSAAATDAPSRTDTRPASEAEESPTAASGPTPSVGSVWVTDSVVHVVNVDGFDVAGSPDGSQFVFASYEEKSRVDPERFRLVVDGEVYEPQPPKDTDFSTIARTADAVDTGQALTGFVVPVRDELQDGTIEYGKEGRVRTLSPETLDRLTADPVFEVRAFSLPDSVGPDEPVIADLTVANVGDGAGTFRAAAPAGAMGATTIERPLDAGEEAQFTEEIELYGTSAGSDRKILLSWADGRQVRTTRFESTPTDGE